MKDTASRIVIGTANFGSVYNNHMVDYTQKSYILGMAKSAGVKYIDTAYLYNCEEFLKPFGKYFKIISKGNSVSLQQSIKNCSPRAYLYHSNGDLDNKSMIYLERFCQNCRENGVIPGFSIYYPSEWHHIKGMDFDFIQIPYNIENKKFYPLLKEMKNKTVFARNIFLNGLLLERYGMDVLRFVLSTKEIDYAVVGVRHSQDLEQILDVEESSGLDKYKYKNYLSIPQPPERQINPLLWGDK